MKILDRYILKSFLVPFLATFFIVLFVLVMQALWMAFDKIAGKGINIYFILKFLYYSCLVIAQQALPIAVLLSSIMTMGTLSENYEFAAAKSASISLTRLLRPLIVLTVLLSIFNFFLSNNVFPYAVLKQKNLQLNLQKKKPALALIPGSFNTEIPNYQIKFEEKYGEERNLLKKVLIYDLSSKKGNKKVITAKRGKISTEEGSKYMTLTLYDGEYFEEHVPTNRATVRKKNMPASQADFQEYVINIDISSLSGDVDEDEKIKGRQTMLTLNQLKDTLPDMKARYDDIVYNKSANIAANLELKKFKFSKDSLYTNKLEKEVLDNFELRDKIAIMTNAISASDRVVNSSRVNSNNLKNERKRLNLYDVEFYNRIALSFSCLILFFIGAPLGSIIRKGGFGLPMILAISIYVVFFFANTLSKNLAEESSISAVAGSWLAIVVMLPLCFFLTRRATKDMGIFNIDVFLQPITKFLKKLRLKKIE